MMKSKNISIGFSHRRYHKLRNRTIIILNLLSLLAPPLILLFIDISKKLEVLIPFILFFPIFNSLGGTIQIWYEYVRHFGVPTFRGCWKMLQLNTLIAYQRDPKNKQRHAFQDAFVMALFSVLFILLWRWTNFVSFLYPATLLIVFSVKAIIRRARPPAILLLGPSSYEATRFQLKLITIVSPTLVASGLHHKSATVNVSGVFSNFVSVRTVEYEKWQEMITSLMQISKVVIIDTRKITDAVQFEIDIAIKALDPDRVFFIGADEESLPSNRCFKENELFMELVLKFNYNLKGVFIKNLFSSAVYEDRKNKYFRFIPPKGWHFSEYPDPRTKVVFFHPKIPDVEVSFLITETPFLHFSSLVLETQKKIQNAPFRASYKMEVTEFLGREAVEMIIEARDGTTAMLRLFLANGLRFNINYSAPTEATFNTFLDEVNHSLLTIEPLNQQRATPSEKFRKAIQQQIAHVVRLAEIQADMFDIDEARKILAELLSKYPDNKQIQDAIKDLNKFSLDKKKE